AAARALDVPGPDQFFDRLRSGGRGPQPAVLHGLAQLLVLDRLAGGFHGGEERRFAVTGRRPGLLLQRDGFFALAALVVLDARQQLVALVRLGPLGFLAIRRLGRQLSVGGAPAGLDQSASPGAKALV